MENLESRLLLSAVTYSAAGLLGYVRHEKAIVAGATPAGRLSRAALAGTTWDYAGWDGNGTLTFTSLKAVAGSITRSDGTSAAITGVYSVSATGQVVLRVHDDDGAAGTVREVLIGTLDTAQGTIDLKSRPEQGSTADPTPVELTGSIATTAGRATVVALSTQVQTASVDSPGVLEISRAHGRTGALTVNFTTSAGDGFGTLGTDYMLQDGAGDALTGSITIPAGQSSVAIYVIPLASGATTPLSAGVSLAAGDGYRLTNHGTTSAAVTLVIPVSTIAAGAPTITNTSATLTTRVGTPRVVTFDDLVFLSGAALGTTDAGHVLQLQVSALGDGTLEYRNGTSAAVAASAGTVLSEGDSLLWIPPPGVSGEFHAFSIVALDGSLTSAQSTQFMFDVY